MLYRLDSQYYTSNYILIDWEKLDAVCKSPEDKDARGRRCGQRATAYKGAKKSVSNLGQKNLSSANQSRLSELRSKIQYKGNMGKVSGKDRLRATQGLIAERNQMPDKQYKASQQEAYKQKLAKKQAGKEKYAAMQARRKAVSKTSNKPLNFSDVEKSAPGKYAKEEAQKERAFQKFIRDIDKVAVEPKQRKRRK